ncbi:Cell division cycle 5 [Heracleum sosnowskyi]|uniref:Cell division cycle 5 n=1 Tax=Heracleum sosnowskyi TaxID=360622 RepID=A0AAD8IMD7_9APIA|nr:Cell division cycle 5 [Heracleum sosnowskyi]
MGTEVLRPQDCLTHRTRTSPAAFHRRKTIFCGYSTGIPKVNKPVAKSEKPDHRRRSPVRYSPEKSTFSKRSASSGDLRYKKPELSNKNNPIAPEKIKILRRGESLMSIKDNANKCDENISVRVGLPDVYAGSAATMSPSPRALPVPSFFKKEGDQMCADDATKDLRRLLGLD